MCALLIEIFDVLPTNLVLLLVTLIFLINFLCRFKTIKISESQEFY